METTMAFHGTTRARGFTLYEFAIVVTITAVLSAVLLHRLDGYRRAAEEVAARQTVAALRMALQVEAQRHPDTLATLAQQNPIHLLSRPPADYLGEFALSEARRVAQNGWVFDPRDKTLVYLTSERERFASGKSELPRFKVELTRNPADAGKHMMSLALNEIGAQGAR
jgi:prepilin-type N-terminal cleavage/methylation domain-containing protein